MRKHGVPGAEGIIVIKTTICQSGGEGWVKIDSKMLKGEHRITESQNFSSPTSKKVIQKSRSVASIRKVFASSSDMKGGGGAANVNGRPISEKQKQNIKENTLVLGQSQNWRQKLLAYRAEESQHKPK